MSIRQACLKTINQLSVGARPVISLNLLSLRSSFANFSTPCISVKIIAVSKIIDTVIWQSSFRFWVSMFRSNLEMFPCLEYDGAY